MGEWKDGQDRRPGIWPKQLKNVEKNDLRFLLAQGAVIDTRVASFRLEVNCALRWLAVLRAWAG